jgi:DNA-binding GntR family transcriptional regulator
MQGDYVYNLSESRRVERVKVRGETMSSASDRAYAAIKTMILSGELASGSQLREEHLAERCGVSRTPVREALHRLEADLLVRRNETQRSFVSEWSLDDIEQAFELRGMLESHASKRAAERMTDERLAQLKACNTALHAAISRPNPDISEFLRQNRAFHRGIIEAAESARLTQVLARIVEQPIVWRTVQNFNRDDLDHSYREHEDLLAAFASGDGVWAASVMATHIRRAFHTYSGADRASPRSAPGHLSAQQGCGDG